MSKGKFNLEEIQKEWNQQDPTIPIPEDLSCLKKAKNPIEKIRRNMMTELHVIVVAILFLIIVPFLKVYQISGISELIYYVVLFLMVVSTLPSYINFYSYYKKSAGVQYNSYRSVSKIYYELKNMIRIYKTVNYVLIPYTFILLFIILSKGKSEFIFQCLMDLPGSFTPENYVYFIALGCVVLFTLLAILFVALWVKQFYSKHLKNLEEILNQFDEDCE